MPVAERPVSLDEIPEVLRWDAGEATADAVLSGWRALVLERLEQLLVELDEDDVELARRLRAGVDALTLESRDRLLLAPESTFRLFWRPRTESYAAGGFLLQSAGVESARAGDPVLVPDGTWSALGDFCVGRGPGPTIQGMPPLDLDSPVSCTVDLTGEHYTVGDARAPLTGEGRGLVLARLEEIARGLPLASPLVAACVERFTTVLVLQRDDEQPFSSGSNGQFIGRSVVANPQLTGIDAAVIADAVVHEAIHALLYMQEIRRPWVLEDAIYDTTPRIVSPWSGRSLPLRPFLHACFVWYGLLNFWARALATDAFGGGSRRELMLRAAGGFLGPPLVAALEPYRHALREELLLAIADMQRDILTCFGEPT